jgi:hypothetical protein
LAIVIALAPLILELLKILWGNKGSEAEKLRAVQEAEASLRDVIARTRAALQKAEDTDGDTSDLEDIANRKPKK